MLKTLILNIIHWLDPKNRRYVSEADQFLQQFDAEHPEKSATQAAEIKKHKDIFNRPISSKIKW